MDALLRIARSHEIGVMEDCAHALGTRYRGERVGSFGDVSVFSLGRDKVISSVNGGLCVINHPRLLSDAESIRKRLVPPPIRMTVQNLLYILIALPARLLYDTLGIGKVLLLVARKCHLFPEILSASERACRFTDFSYTYPNALAAIGRHELQRLDEYNAHRVALSRLYREALSDRMRFAPEGGK